MNLRRFERVSVSLNNKNENKQIKNKYLKINVKIVVNKGINKSTENIIVKKWYFVNTSTFKPVVKSN